MPTAVSRATAAPTFTICIAAYCGTTACPLRARDVVASWRAVMDPRHNTLHREGYDRVVGIDDARRVHRGRASRPALPAVRHAIFCAVARGRETDSSGARAGARGRLQHRRLERASGRHRAVCFVSWERGSRIVLARNEHYFKGRPNLEKIELDIVPNDQTILAQVAVASDRSGRLAPERACGSIPGARATSRRRSILGTRRCRSALTAASRCWPIAAVRRAIVDAIDYDRLIETVRTA